ncbi:beta-sarcoglycan isoform X2 [Ictalurus punctatus]|uniref:Beta-sarcoglycan n=1 Tax=Ictalurus punctatus TaxID=7998 RepID=A0A9F7TG48_ICTPU|nr:beta-sarcoglycan isoform X2 [Ictalurus punctatus]
MASEQESSNGPVKKSMREKAIERRTVSKEHNSNFKAGYVPIEEERLHKTGLRGRKGNIAVCIIVLLFLLALINLIITLVIWTVIRIGPNGCDSMEFHESGLLRFKQKADMGVVHPLHKSTVGGRKDQDLVITGNNNPVVFQQGNTRLSVEKDKTSITSDLGISFTDPRTQTTFFSTDFDNHEFHLPKQVKVLNVKKASTERYYSFPSLELRGPNLFLHDDDLVHKASSMKTWCVKVGVEELECPAQSPDHNPTEHFWDELEHRLHLRPPHTTSLYDLSNALVAE